MNKENRLPVNLQFFAEGSAGSGGAANVPQDQGGAAQLGQATQQTSTPAIDYAKIQQMLDGTLAAKEDTALKAYFKQQGLSQQEAEQAMSEFKAQKAKNQPDVNAMQTQLSQAQAEVCQSKVENAATMAAIGMGLDAKTIPYVLKMADLSTVMGQDGKINEETLKNALNKVLEDVPALKPQAAGAAGFTQVGATSGSQQGTNSEDSLKKAFGLL